MITESLSNAPEGKSFRRVAICLQYDGSGFSGWQFQPHRPSVQGVLQEAIQSLDPYRPIKAIAAGRTDAGVHAAGQVVHFDCSGRIPSDRWVSALNGRLPKTIRVREAISMPRRWHACHSANYRRYRYTIYNGCRPNLFLDHWTWHRYQIRLDDALMRKALDGLIGYHDFSAFQRSGSKRADGFTTIQAVDIEREGDLVVIEIQATGFLYGMVRLLVGQLVMLGEHRLALDSFERRWKQQRRQEVKESAPAKGLCLLRVGYEEQLFSEVGWFESFPKYVLSISDPPADPLEIKSGPG
ncbi:tRNA pseudouridine(38-40) synthase TruA [Prochlorococcus sp. MIT 1300]|uniref:tRNA pseudouridine(38-40) synthase TruA n=1 Tax=Prochlorococcus sp. MIT 1300 TaxID=3096218 RepID=UPI002A7643C7|nr:tRNA pseudouridine(38-40) synthase TruA [Prochlorococcus sp. MIT 1300]